MEELAPPMFAPPFCHRYANGAVPAATTVKVALWPEITLLLTGWVVIEGATKFEGAGRVDPPPQPINSNRSSKGKKTEMRPRTDTFECVSAQCNNRKIAL